MKRKLDNIFGIESKTEITKDSPSILKNRGEDPREEHEQNLQDLSGSIEQNNPSPPSLEQSSITKKNLEKMLEDLEKDIIKNKNSIDEILHMAVEDYKKMMYLAYSSEPKIAGSIFEPAVELLRTVLEKKGNHIDQKLQLYKTMIMKSRVDKIKDENKSGEGFDESGEITIIDRNKLLSIIKKEEK